MYLSSSNKQDVKNLSIYEMELIDMQIDLNGKVAVVTGCDGAIGLEICHVLAQNGATVFVQAFSIAAACDVVEKIRSEKGKAYPLGGDISDDCVVEQMTKIVMDQCGRVDILVNNTDIHPIKEDQKEIQNYCDDVWANSIAVDMNGAYHCAKYFSKLMVDAGGGRIINVASAGGIVGLQKHSAVVASSAGLLGFTRAMAAELGKYGVLVNAVAAGSICNESNEQTCDNKALLDHIPLGRQGTAQEVANTVAFLAAPETAYMTGATITVDGGWSCGFMRDW